MANIATIYWPHRQQPQDRWEAFRGIRIEDQGELIGYGETEFEAVTNLFVREDQES